jgi:hypothetical protein
MAVPFVEPGARRRGRRAGRCVCGGLAPRVTAAWPRAKAGAWRPSGRDARSSCHVVAS